MAENLEDALRDGLAEDRPWMPEAILAREVVRLRSELSQAKADLAKAQTEVGRLNIEAEGQAVLLRIRDASITKMKHEAAMEKNFNDTVKDSLREGQAELLSRAEAAEAALSAIRQTDGKAREVVKDLLGMNPDAGERMWFETAQRLMGESTDLKARDEARLPSLKTQEHMSVLESRCRWLEARAERAEAIVGSINRERDALEEQKFAAMKDQIAKMLDHNKKLEALAKEQERVIEKMRELFQKLNGTDLQYNELQRIVAEALALTPPQSEKPCAARSPEIKGGVYSCLKMVGHEGRHYGESGDARDFGDHGDDWTIGDGLKPLTKSAKRGQ